MCVLFDAYEKNEYLYHNTEVILKRYRDVVWSIEVSAMHAKTNFEYEMDCSLDDFLEKSYSAGADLSTGTKIQEQMRTMQRNKNMLNIIDASVKILRKKPINGKMYYWILHYTYFSEHRLKNVDEIIFFIEKETKQPMSRKTYFRRKKEAINELSIILWGFTSKEYRRMLEVICEKTNKV